MTLLKMSLIRLLAANYLSINYKQDLTSNSVCLNKR